MVNVDRKTIIVFGGSGGIGSVVAATFLKAGANVVIVGRKPDALARKKEEFNSPRNLICITGDASHLPDVMKVFEETIETFGRVDGVFAGIGNWVRTDESSSPEKLIEAEAEMRPAHVTAVGLIADESQKAFGESGCVFFHVSSHAVHKPESKLSGNITYRKLKIEAETLLEKYASKNFRVINLRPSIVNTPKNEEVLTKDGIDNRGGAVNPQKIADSCLEHFDDSEISQVIMFESEFTV